MIIEKKAKRVWTLLCDTCGKVFDKKESPSKILRNERHVCSKECGQTALHKVPYRAGKIKYNRTLELSVHRRNGEVWIPLTQRLWTVIFSKHWDLVKDITWTASAHHKTFYATGVLRDENGKRYKVYMHRLLCPDFEAVDHKDGNGLNNREDNHRPANKAQNARNSRVRTDSKSGIRGVSWIEPNQKWRAIISVSGKTVYLGYYDSKEEAIAARKSAEQEVDPEFYNTR